MVGELVDRDLRQQGVQGREQCRAEAGEGAHPQGHPLDGLPGALEGLRQVSENVRRLRGQRRAGRGRPGAGGVPDEERRPDATFQSGEPLARRRLGDEQLTGGGTDRTMAMDGVDQEEISDLWQ